MAKEDKRIIAHLSHGGSVYNQEGRILIAGLIRESLKNQKIASAVARHQISNNLLVRIYQQGYETLLPSPAIMHGTPCLVPSLPFMDEDHFPGLLDHCVTSAYSAQDDEEREQLIIDIAANSMRMARDHAERQGRVLAWPIEDWPTLEQLSKKTTGCLPIIVFGFLAGVGLAFPW